MHVCNIKNFPKWYNLRGFARQYALKVLQIHKMLRLLRFSQTKLSKSFRDTEVIIVYKKKIKADFC